MNERKRCTRCCVLLPVSHFNVKRSGDYYKICAHCTNVKHVYINRIKNNNNNTDIISISHNALGGNLTRFVHSEATGFTVFPAYSQVHQLSTYLKKYAGLSKQAIEKIFEIGETKSRWLYVSNLAPMFVVYEKGIYLVK